MVIEGRFPYPFEDGEDSDVKGWVVPQETLESAIDTRSAGEEGVWFAVRDRETGEYIDPERFGLFIRVKNEESPPEDAVYIWYGGGPGIDEDDGDGWYDDFPPIPPGP
jgi:hypothetical protein